MKDQSGLRRVAIILFFAMLVSFVVHVQILSMFNRRETEVRGNTPESPAYMAIDPRADTTSKWLKRDFVFADGRVADLTGQTIDETLYNNSGDTIRDWGLRINIAGDCFVNQCWTGTVEIHQFTGTEKERVQTLNLQDYVLDDVELECVYDGDLLIPLQAGDYILYFPNEHYNEMPVGNGEKVTIGMIFYYLDNLDLSDYTLSVHFHRSFTQGWSFIVFIAMAGLWILFMAMYAASVLTYRSAQKQMELKKSSLSYMSELYEAIYIINLAADEITPVSPGQYVETLRAKIHSAKELLQAAVRGDADESCMDATLAFVDTDTLAERMEGCESIVYEFISSLHGWCRFRFFPMDRAEGKPLESVIFAVQDINDERSEVKDLSDRLERAESVAAANNSFLAAASRDLQAPVRELLDLDSALLKENDPEKIRKYAEGIRGTGERMLALIGGLADRAALEAGEGNIAAERYSLTEVLRNVFRAVSPLAERKGIRLEADVSETVPDALFGDAGKLKEAAVSLLAEALNSAADGAVRLSVFGRVSEDTVHLLFSARAVPENEGSGAAAPAREDRKADLNLEVAGSLLAGMGSGLKSVRSPDEWKDRYFEIDQRIADAAPAGRITAEDLMK